MLPTSSLNVLLFQLCLFPIIVLWKKQNFSSIYKAGMPPNNLLSEKTCLEWWLTCWVSSQRRNISFTWTLWKQTFLAVREKHACNVHSGKKKYSPTIRSLGNTVITAYVSRGEDCLFLPGSLNETGLISLLVSFSSPSWIMAIIRKGLLASHFQDFIMISLISLCRW